MLFLARNSPESDEVTDLRYREDIDGLRAIAIVAVVLYHAKVPGFGGGFAGVDIFFPISGYLIIGALASELSLHGKINWLEFFAHRARRLLPEAIVMMVVTLMLGYCILFPFDSSQVLAKSTVAATLWVSNIYFWRGQRLDYFNPYDELNPLLHTWSLGVEEQFYVTLPIVFVIFKALVGSKTKFFPTLFVVLSIYILGASLLSATWGALHPDAAFYLLPTRGYEIAVGGLAALASPPRFSRDVRRLVSGMAFAGSICPFLLADRAIIWPSGWALIPAGGTAVLLWLNRVAGTDGIVRALSSPPITQLGRASYSFYLWHFPLLALTHAYRYPERDVWTDLFVCGFALLIGVLSNTYLRESIRARWPLTTEGDQRRWLALLIGVSAVPLLMAATLFAMAETAVSHTPVLQQIKRTKNDIYTQGVDCQGQIASRTPHDDACVFGAKNGALRVYLWGDSHANQWVPAFAQTFESLAITGVERWLGGCPPISGYTSPLFTGTFEKQCIDFNNRTINEILGYRGRIAVVLGARWPIYFGERPLSASYRSALFDHAQVSREKRIKGVGDLLDKTIEALVVNHIPVLIMGSVPEFPTPIPDCVFRYQRDDCSVARAMEERLRANSLAAMSQFSSEYPNVFLFDPMPLMCDSSLCRPTVGPIVLFHDDNHLSVQGARHFSPAIRSALERLQRSVQAQ